MLLVFTAKLPASANGADRITAVEGLSRNGNRVRIVWTSSGGDIQTILASGAYEETWFSGGRVIWRGLSGDTHEAFWDPAYQLARILLTSQLDTLRVTQTTTTAQDKLEHRVLNGIGWLEIRRDLEGRMLRADSSWMSFRDFAFDGQTATSWIVKSDDGFPGFPDLMSGRVVEAPKAMPIPPTSIWGRATSNTAEEKISASVGSHVASITIDSAENGLLVSPTFAHGIGAVADTNGIVELHDVSIAGAHASKAFARLASDSRYDLRAGITLFPGATIMLDRLGHASLTKAPCLDGLPFVGFNGTTMLRLGRTSVLFDSAHVGPPVAADLNFNNPLIDKPCDNAPRPITIANKKFGSDVVCYGRNLFKLNRGADFMILGLHSLSADRLFIDMRKSEICWH